MRRLRDITARASLLLCLTVAGWSVRSVFYSDVIRYETAERYYECYSKRGFLAVGTSWNTWPITQWMRTVGGAEEQADYLRRAPGVAAALRKEVPHWNGETSPVADDQRDFWWSSGHPFLRAFDLGVSSYLSGPHFQQTGDWLVVPYTYPIIVLAAPTLILLLRRARRSRGTLGTLYVAARTTLAVLSLLMAGVVAACWCRSYWSGYVVQINIPGEKDGGWASYGELRQVSVFRGTLRYVCRQGRFYGGAEPAGWNLAPVAAADAAAYWPNRNDTFEAWDEDINATPERWREHYLSTSIGWCALAFALAPAFCLWQTRRHFKARRRLALNLCPTCGYDLRASSERCPECGSVIIKATP